MPRTIIVFAMGRFLKKELQNEIRVSRKRGLVFITLLERYELMLNWPDNFLYNASSILLSYDLDAIIINNHGRFGRLFYPANGGNNIGIYLPAWTASHP